MLGRWFHLRRDFPKITQQTIEDEEKTQATEPTTQTTSRSSLEPFGWVSLNKTPSIKSSLATASTSKKSSPSSVTSTDVNSLPTGKAKQAGVGESRWQQNKVAAAVTCGEVFFDGALVFAVNHGNDHGSVVLERIQRTVRPVELLARLDRFSLVPHRFTRGIFDQHPAKRSRVMQKGSPYAIAITLTTVPDLFHLRFRIYSDGHVLWAWLKFHVDQPWRL